MRREQGIGRYTGLILDVSTARPADPDADRAAKGDVMTGLDLIALGISAVTLATIVTLCWSISRP